jgi:hypothetical protein
MSEDALIANQLTTVLLSNQDRARGWDGRGKRRAVHEQCRAPGRHVLDAVHYCLGDHAVFQETRSLWLRLNVQLSPADDG